MLPAHLPNRWSGEDQEDTPLPQAELGPLGKEHGGSSLKLERWYETMTEIPGAMQGSRPNSREHAAKFYFHRPCMQGSRDCLPDHCSELDEATHRGLETTPLLPPTPRSGEQKPHLS